MEIRAECFSVDVGYDLRAIANIHAYTGDNRKITFSRKGEGESSGAFVISHSIDGAFFHEKVSSDHGVSLVQFWFSSSARGFVLPRLLKE